MSNTAFTRQQLQAVDPGPRPLDTCVVAGPGSGKTTVLVEYFRRLVCSGADPLRVLAITFTEKAAGHMRQKLMDAFQDDSRIRARLERAWISTIHGFCGRLLRENAVFAGVDPQFYIADESESWRLQQESVRAAVEGLFSERATGMRALICGLSSADFEPALLEAYDAMRCAGMTIGDVAGIAPPAGITRDEIRETICALKADRLIGWSHTQRSEIGTILEDAERVVNADQPLDALRAIEQSSGSLNRCKRSTTGYNLASRLKDQIKGLYYRLITELYLPERELLFDVLRRFDSLYRERKRAAGALDFADLEEHMVRLLEDNPQIRARIQDQFDHVLMDEFQDTNRQQAKLLDLIRRPDRFYAVGDINQSIFAFRHAEPEVFQEYRDSVERNSRRLVELTDNFRSRPEILRAVETIAHGAGGIEPRALIASREFGGSLSGPDPVFVEVLCAPDLFTEARWVARRIMDMHSGARPFAFGKMAVLVRNTEVLAEFSSAFEEAGIPYVVNRGKGFYEAREVRDLVHLLRVIANPRDEISLAAVLRSPLVRASDEALAALKLRGENLGSALMHAGPESEPDFEAADYAKLIRFRDRLGTWRRDRETISFDRLLAAALDDCGYECASGARGWANIDKFLAQAREASGKLSLDEFVDQLDLLRADNLREGDAPPDDSSDAVNVMTVHSAKGLEFPVVFVAALHKGVDTEPAVIAFSRTYGLGARWRNPASVRRNSKDDLFLHAIRKELKKREEKESDRLLYVAMTRAEEHLIFSFSGDAKKNWAQQVAAQLGLELDKPCDESVTRTAPDGTPWKLRLLIADSPPELIRNEARDSPVAPAVQWIAPPAAGDQYETNTTVTALSAFAICPRRYYLGHYLGFEGYRPKLTQDEDLAAADLGTMVHDLLAGAEVPNVSPKAVALAEVARRSPLGRRAEHASRVEREFGFIMAIDGLVLHGKIDLWFEEAGELIIVDYKTDSVTAAEAHKRAQDYAVQLRFYGIALERLTGRAPCQAWLHFLRPNIAVEVDLAPSLLESPDQMVRDFQAAQSRLEFPLNEGGHCHRCPFMGDLCPVGRR